MKDFWTKTKLYCFKLVRGGFSRLTAAEWVITILLLVGLVGGAGFGIYRAVAERPAIVDPPEPPVDDPPVDPVDPDLIGIEEHLDEIPSVTGDRKKDNYTFLILGTDASGVNTDLLILARYNGEKHTLNLVNIPKNTIVNAPWDMKRISSVYAYYTDGTKALKQYVKTLFGFVPDYTVQINMMAFVELVNTVGGLEYEVPMDMDYEDAEQGLSIHLKAGKQELDGEQVLQLVRFNQYGNSGHTREETQGNVLKLILQQCLSIKNWTKLKEYVELLDYVNTELTPGNVLYFAGETLLHGLTVYTKSVKGTEVDLWSRTALGHIPYFIPDETDLVTLSNGYLNPYFAQVDRSMLDLVTLNEDGSLTSSSGTLLDQEHNDAYAKWVKEKREDEPFYESAEVGPLTPTLDNTEESSQP